MLDFKYCWTLILKNMEKVKLVLRDIVSPDAYSKHPEKLQVGDVIEFDRMPEFDTWTDNIAHNSAVVGFDYIMGLGTAGTNLRTGVHQKWCFHAVKFERV